MRGGSVLAAALLAGCAGTPLAFQAYPISPASNAAFFATAERGSVTLLAGYAYDRSRFDVLAFDRENSTIVAREQFNLTGGTLVCEGRDGLVLDGSEGPLVIGYRSGSLFTEISSVRCPDSAVTVACGEGRLLFNGWLPGRWDQLAICYSPDERATTFHIMSADGTRRDLGAAGTSPGGSGRFVVTRGLLPGTFLAHHTSSAIAESAVLINADAGTLEAFDLPDLYEARPSRGFGAGSFGVTLHPVRGGVVAEGEGGEVFLLKDGKTTKLVDDAVAQSVHIAALGCSVVLVARVDAGEELRVYDVCGG